MKRILCILLALSFLTAQFSNAQNCPANPTYLNTGGSFDLSAGRSIVLNGGKEYNITVQNNFYSDASICVTNGSSLTLSFLNVNTIQKGGSIYVDKTSKLTINGNINNFPLTITNAGTVAQNATITFEDGATINNSGTYTMSAESKINTGTINFTNSNTFNFKNNLITNTAAFKLANTSAGIITFSNAESFNNTTLTNAGTINFNSLLLQGSSTVTNNGYMYMNNTGSQSLFLSAGSTVNNNGVMYVYGSTMINNGNTLNNACTLKNVYDLTNAGKVNNTGSILLTVSASSTLKNQGPFINGTTGFVQGTHFSNDNSVTGGGNFYFSDNTKNQGTFAGTNGNSINFYDASNSTSNIFDNQISNPTNTTKNKIASNSATTFTSCADVTAPAITVQPSVQSLCTPATTSATFSVTATSKNTPAYQWYKNGTVISGATSSSYTVSNLTLADTIHTYSVTVTNAAGTTTSNSANVKYIIISQPTPVTQYLATGNATSFTVKTSGATAWQWLKDGNNISNATAVNYALSVVNYADSGKYSVKVSYNGGVCTSDIAALKTSIILYSKATGNINLPATWGVEKDGSGSTPVDFTREEHTFVVSNRASVETVSDLTIAGKFDVANSKVIITPGTTLDAGRIIRSLSTGVIAASSTSNLTVHGIASPDYAGASDLYFDESNNTIQNVITSAHAVTLHNALNITSGKTPGFLQVNSGSFFTSDALTLKSDSLGTGSIAKSAGTINSKVTIEKFIHARRAWRFMGAPITNVDAPTINAAWQEGAKSSTDNPHPGYGTHITYGAVADGFDQNPQKTFSAKFYSDNAWVGVPATNKTKITDYPAYMIFIRGNRSYNILTTTTAVAPMTTIMRVTGNIYQGNLAAKTVTANGFTLVMNPYASPVSFAKIANASSNIKKRIRVWDPTLAGDYGVGGWVTVDGTRGKFRVIPFTANVSSIIPAGQGFVVESGDEINTGSMVMNENAKDLSVTTSADREGEESTDTSLEINLKVFNDDNTTAIADGLLYRFNNQANDSADVNDATKMFNFSESISAKEGNNYLTIDERTLPATGDSLRLYMNGAKTTKYQLEFVPTALENKTFALYDKYLNTLTTLNSTDTTLYTFSINTAVVESKGYDRFRIIVQKTITVLPVTFTKVKAYAKDKAVQVEWNVENESNITYYEVEISTNGTSFTKAGTIKATGANSYSFTDATPANGINYYRIKSVGIASDIHYTSIVNVTMEAVANSAVSIYPNPVTGTSFTLKLTNITAGKYALSVVNANGAVLFSKTVIHNGGTASQKVTLQNKLAAGIYYLKITAQDGTTNILKVSAN